MPMTILRLLLAGGLLSATLGALAQDDDYWIEVLVYEHFELAPFLFKERVSTHKISDIQAYQEPLNNIQVQEPLLLVERAQSIENDPELVIIGHYAWRQPQLEQKDSINVPIVLMDHLKQGEPSASFSLESATGASADLPLTGWVRVYTSGPYLFTNVSFEFQPGSARAPEIVWITDESIARYDYQITEIIASRRLLLTEIHLFDNEVLGALLTVWPIQKVNELLEDE